MTAALRVVQVRTREQEGRWLDQGGGGRGGAGPSPESWEPLPRNEEETSIPKGSAPGGPAQVTRPSLSQPLGHGRPSHCSPLTPTFLSLGGWGLASTPGLGHAPRGSLPGPLPSPSCALGTTASVSPPCSMSPRTGSCLASPLTPSRGRHTTADMTCGVKTETAWAGPTSHRQGTHGKCARGRSPARPPALHPKDQGDSQQDVGDKSEGTLSPQALVSCRPSVDP